MNIKRKTYRTYETPIKGVYVTELVDKPNLDDLKLVSYKLRILDVNFDVGEGALELYLREEEKGFSVSYALLGYNEIKSFLKDMQITERSKSRKEILALKGRTLDGIFDNYEELYGLCPTAHKGELSPYLFNKLKDKIQKNKEEMKAGNSS